ncbi:COG4315 family predicted lipoprotein [Pseudogemmobacter faecipullorum]|uniref:Lipoprotein n=1 Tax=Pseudogemmobacter faecipullorum TaxID=2755041 RepID=A0ABS8CIY2_9RHOB|nr:hypothetical protein [Pseudogemmobacter faecipullorum]MCB5409357.1 hypothetical protein [Pseudogemmobacter faecipullorum]
MKSSISLLSAFLVILPVGVASAQTLLTNDAKMTLYTYDKDEGGKSACYDDCATKWPPYIGKAGEDKGEGWTLVERTDGTHQWSYDGKPTYLYAEDTKAGDMLGDGKGGVWHVIKD